MSAADAPSSSSSSSSSSSLSSPASSCLHETLQSLLIDLPRSEVQAKIFTSDFSSSPDSSALRGICWRLMLGVLQDTDGSVSKWISELKESVATYSELKSKLMPKMEDVLVDPLTGLTSDASNGQGDEWKQYYSNVELTNFIKGDLSRLYMTGIADDFFEDQNRRNIILHVLFVWAAQNKTTSYRQGMHEIAGPILFVLEKELEAFENSPSDLSSSFSKDTLEAHTYYIFEKIMDEMEPLYDPTTSVIDGQPQVVHFCANLQENLLRQLDPALCDHLEQSFVQSQIYGMRWARLILGREFPLTCTHCLRIWDYVFACACSANAQVNVEMKIDDKIDNEAILKSKTRYSITTPMLIAIGNFMLAMLLHIREELIEGDDNTTLSLLMHYPEFDDITPILDLADMIRRGVLIPGAHTGVGTLDEDPKPSALSKVPSASPDLSIVGADIYASSATKTSKVPSWLGTTASSVSSKAASKLKKSASSVLNAASSALRSTKNRSGSNEDSFGRISSPSDFNHVQHGSVEDAKKLLGQIDDEGKFLSSPVDLISTRNDDSLTRTTMNSTLSSMSSPRPSEEKISTNDPFGQERATSLSSTVNSVSVPDFDDIDIRPSMINEMDVFSSATSTSTGARTDNSEKTLSAMSLLLDTPVSKTTFNPTKAFCAGVAERLENILGQAEIFKDNDRESENTSPKQQLKMLADILRGRVTLVKYDETYKCQNK